MKIKSCDCFEKLRKGYEKKDIKAVLNIIKTSSGYCIYIGRYYIDKATPISLVSCATFCPYCGKKIEVKDE